MGTAMASNSRYPPGTPFTANSSAVDFDVPESALEESECGAAGTGTSGADVESDTGWGTFVERGLSGC